MEIKKLGNKLIKSIEKGWKRLGKEDVQQEVEVVYPTDTFADLKILEKDVDYEYQLKSERKSSKNKEIPQSYSGRNENGRTMKKETREISKENSDKGEIIR